MQPEYSSANATAMTSGPSQPEVPAPFKGNRMRSVTINQLDYGYMVTVGCQNFCFEKKEKLLKNLERYMANPESIEDFWMKRELKLDL